MKRNASQTGGFLYREKVKLVLQEDAIYPEEMEKAGIYLNLNYSPRCGASG